MTLNSILSPYFCSQNNLDVHMEYEIEKCDARRLINPNRLDLMAKLKYVEHKEKGYYSNFVKRLYASHIEAFSLGTYKEPGNEQKDSIDKYFAVFNELISEIKMRGVEESVSVIPVGANNVILDGAHRTAIAAYFGREVPIIRFPNLSVRYDAAFFKSRLLDRVYLDFLVSEYAKLKNNIYCAVVWPKARGANNKQKMLEKINATCHIVYEKQAQLTYDGICRLVGQIYSHQEWIGTIENQFAGARFKADACFESDGTITVYVLECDKPENVVKMKQEIRGIFGVGNHSIHITDNNDESVGLLSLLLNQNSIDFLNTGNPYLYPSFLRNVEMFKQRLRGHNFALDDFIIDSSSTLSLFGLREAEDLDFITVAKDYEVIEDDIASNHHDYVLYHHTSMDDLVFNPNNYFVFNDLKFVTLKVLRLFKNNRRDSKDFADIKLIDGFLKQRSIPLTRLRNQIERGKRNVMYKFRNAVGQYLRAVGLYNSLRTIYHFLKMKDG